MKLELLAKLPDWPARMTSDVAAIYMGVSETTFRTRYGASGKKEGANVLWARAQLDRIIANQFGLAQPNGGAEAGDDSWADVR
jgi:hypothetical protein